MSRTHRLRFAFWLSLTAALAYPSTVSPSPSAATVTVDADDVLGPAEVTSLLAANFVGLGDEGSAPDADWPTRVGTKYHRGSVDYARVTRLPNCTDTTGKCIQLDYASLDSALARELKLPTRGLVVGFFQIPQALSSRPDKVEPLDHWSQYAPSHWEEWGTYVRNVVRHLAERWNMRGLYYQVWNEPEDHTYYWKGTLGRSNAALIRARDPGTGTDYWKVSSGRPDTLANYVKLYVTTARAIKEADPSAKVGGPASSHWDNMRHPKDPAGYKLWGLPEFLRALKNYIKSTGEAVPLDFIDWHDYCWASTRVSDGADFVDGLVAELGFSPKPAYVISEWNREWGWSCGHYTLLQHASHAAHNLIRELNPEKRRIAQMYWFAFDLDGSCPNTALSTGRVSESVLKRHSAAREPECLRPAYAVFEMINAMRSGQFVRTTATGPLEALAVREGQRVTVIVNNNTDSELRATVHFTDLPGIGTSVKGTIRRVDQAHSADCKGLEPGTSGPRHVESRAVREEILLPPYATAQITLAE